jgi:hypothetical protein
MSERSSARVMRSGDIDMHHQDETSSSSTMCSDDAR